MAQQPSIAHLVELELLNGDSEFYFELVQCILKDRHAHILVPTLIPHLALIVIESYQYFSNKIPGFARDIKLKHQNLIRQMRHKVKMLEEIEIEDTLEAVTNYQRCYFIEVHTGVLGPLKKMLATDLAVVYYQDHLISTSHIQYTYLLHKQGSDGKPDLAALKEIADSARSVSEEIGSYLASIRSVFTQSNNKRASNSCTDILDGLPIHSKDVNSQEFLASVFNDSLDERINSSLVLVISYANFVHYIISRMSTSGDWSLFKVRYLTLYHLWMSLQKLQDKYYAKGLLSPDSKQVLASIFEDKALSFLMKRSKFRTALTHYKVAALPVPEAALDLNIPLFGLVEYFFGGAHLEELNATVDFQLARVSSLMEEWMLGRNSN